VGEGEGEGEGDAQDPCCVPCVDGAWNYVNRHCQKQALSEAQTKNLRVRRHEPPRHSIYGRSPGRVSGSHLEGGGRKRSFIEIKKWLEDSSEEEEEDSCEES
jgi:hypothetical protein